MRDHLIRQFDIAWKLCSHHLAGLTTEECLWRPAAAGLHVERRPDELWMAEWPEQEGYDLGPPSIAWLTWHIGFWWRQVITTVTDDELRSTARTRWPFQARPFGDVVSWVNIELTKNAAEIGYARFLYAVRNSQ